MFLLLLALTPRNSSANPIAKVLLTDGAPIVRTVVDITKVLTKSIEWFQDNIRSSSVDDAIRSLEADVQKLPIEIAKLHQEMLEGLYRSQARVVGTRSVLEGFAFQLKSQCEGLIAMYNRNDVSVELLSYSVTKFIKLARNVKVILKDASSKLKEAQNELIKSKVTLKTYNYHLGIKEQDSSKVHKGKVRVLNRNKWLIVGFTLGLAAPIAIPIINGQIADLKDILEELQRKIDKVQETIPDLIENNDQMSSYVMEEIELVNLWEMKLQQSLSDHLPYITPEDIKFGIEEIKGNLNVLKQACINYLNHKLPEILQSPVHEDIYNIHKAQYETVNEDINGIQNT